MTRSILRTQRTAKWAVLVGGLAVSAVVSSAQAPTAPAPGQAPAVGAGQQAPAPGPGGAPGAPGAARGQGRGGGGRGIQAPAYPVLAIGSDLPSFSLPNVDGKMVSPTQLRSKVLAIMFESNHCPASLAYQERVHSLLSTYGKSGFGLVLINPNNPKGVRLAELGYTDMNDSVEEMKLRYSFNKWTLPYLYDGDTQKTAMVFGAVATPHIFIFDADRKLRYQGAIDDSRNSTTVKQKYAADAIEALLAGRPVATPESRALGCATKWMGPSIAGVEAEMKAIQSTPVTLTPVDAAGLKAIRANATSNKTTIVSFWRTGNRLAEAQFASLQESFRMYSLSPRPVDLITVSLDAPDKADAVLAYLKSQYATSTNRQFSSTDMAAAQAAFGLKWNTAQPFTVVIDPAGNITYQKSGAINIREVRTTVLTTVPDNPTWPGIQDYYKNVLVRMRASR